jgi:uncharacterized small protein (DUF1192 family)
MKQLELLEQELMMLQENIKRVKAYKKECETQKWKPYQSNVVGELKHRIIALKARLTLVSAITTSSLFEK